MLEGFLGNTIFFYRGVGIEHKDFRDVAGKKRAEQYHSAVGAWLSPWGGYGSAKEERMKYGREQGFETNARGFSLAGPAAD